MTWRRKIAEGIAIFYIRYGRGSSLLSFVETLAKNIIYLGAGTLIFKAWLNIDLSKALMVSIAIFYSIFCYVLGWIDERIGFWHFQNDYQTQKLTPFWADMKQKIDEIHARK